MGASAVQVTQSIGFILGALALFGSLVQKDSLSHRAWTYANIGRGVQYTRDFFASLSLNTTSLSGVEVQLDPLVAFGLRSGCICQPNTGI
jgi:hypothetical protein